MNVAKFGIFDQHSDKCFELGIRAIGYLHIRNGCFLFDLKYNILPLSTSNNNERSSKYIAYFNRPYSLVTRKMIIVRDIWNLN